MQDAPSKWSDQKQARVADLTVADAYDQVDALYAKPAGLTTTGTGAITMTPLAVEYERRMFGNGWCHRPPNSTASSSRLWETTGRAQLTILNVTPTGALAFNPGGNLLAVPTADGTTRVYAIDVDDLLDLARSRVTRHFALAECRRYFQSGECPSGS